MKFTNIMIHVKIQTKSKSYREKDHLKDNINVQFLILYASTLANFSFFKYKPL